jgi:hypothetical protein
MIDAGFAGSCGILVERWGAKQELSGGEPFDDTHDSTAERAVPVQGRASMVW